MIAKGESVKQCMMKFCEALCCKICIAYQLAILYYVSSQGKDGDGMTMKENEAYGPLYGQSTTPGL